MVACFKSSRMLPAGVIFGRLEVSCQFTGVFGDIRRQFRWVYNLRLKFSVTVSVSVRNWPHHSGWQIDSKFPMYLGLVIKFDLFTPEEKAKTQHDLAKLWGPNWEEKQKENYKKYLEEYDAEHGPIERLILENSIWVTAIMTIIAIRQFLITRLFLPTSAACACRNASVWLPCGPN